MTFGSTFGRTFSPLFQPKSQAKKGGGWWNLDGTLTSCVVAYRAKGAASLAASKVDLSGNGYDIDGGSDPSFASGTGWQFNGTSQYLTASEFPINNAAFTIAIFGKPSIDHSSTSAIISPNSNSTGWILKSEQWNNSGKIGYTVRTVADYTSTIATPTTDSVLICTRNGTSVNIYLGESSSAITTGNMKNILDAGIVIGAAKTATYGDYYKDYIYAVAVYSAVLTAQNITDLATAMAAL